MSYYQQPQQQYAQPQQQYAQQQQQYAQQQQYMQTQQQYMQPQQLPEEDNTTVIVAVVIVITIVVIAMIVLFLYLPADNVTPSPTSYKVPMISPTQYKVPMISPTISTPTISTPTISTPTISTPTISVPRVNGNWSNYALVSACSATCGGGKKISKRSCTNPVPSGGGSYCVGSDTLEESCNIQPCVINTNGTWSPWVDSAPCSVQCGSGTKTQFRTCVGQSGSGSPCAGSTMQTTECNTQPCPINGNWSAWEFSGECNTQCGPGSRLQSRSCTNPSPANGGATCDGQSTQYIDCNLGTCGSDGVWGLQIHHVMIGVKEQP
jgi:hypothetical protein